MKRKQTWARLTLVMAVAIILAMVAMAAMASCTGADGDESTEPSVVDTTAQATTSETDEESTTETAVGTTAVGTTAVDTTAADTTADTTETIVPETSEETNAPGTTSETDGSTEPESQTEDPRDTPRTDITYTTSSNLVYTPYFFSDNDLDNDGIQPASRDVWADLWVATDDADRVLPTLTTGTPGAQAVGMFYFLWNEANLNGFPLYDHYKAYMEGGIDKMWEVMASGELGFVRHYWAEPMFGYYSSEDAWVIRKHGYMLAEAGVDFVFFDMTNGVTYDGVFRRVMQVWSEMRREGYRTPDVCFFSAGSSEEFNHLWSTVYEKNFCEDLWFRWNGKPVILLMDNVSMTKEQQEFFTIRYSWANTMDTWYQKRSGNACWAWRDTFRQKVGYSENHEIEQISVTCGYSANGKWGEAGRSTYRSRMPKYEGDWDFGFAVMESATPYGYLFADQFEHALTKNTKLIMVTGWNEWTAGRWEGGPAVGQVIGNQYSVSSDPTVKEHNYYVDNLNPEYSRDLEPMKGGFGDNYYYQLINYVRQYKGTRAPEAAFGQWAIDLDGSVVQWYAVGPEFRDYEGDIVDRDAPSHTGGLHYTDTSGRNDIVTAKVSSDSRYLYFYVECASDITSPEGEAWMNLFINADCADETGWYGFDFLLNRTQEGNTVSVERFIGMDTWETETVGTAEYRCRGRVLAIKVEKALLGIEGDFDFKWADNSVVTGDIQEFFTRGDAAPSGRCAYRFTQTETPVKLPDCLTEDMIVLKSGSYNAFVNGMSVRLVEDNTLGVLWASDHDLWLPASFLESVGISTEGGTTYNHYGMTYVHATPLIAAAGKVVTIDSRGLVIIADAEVTDYDVRTTLYRCLT